MRGLPRIAWVGLAILAVAAFLLSLGKRELAAFPSADSFAPSGASALAQLLKANGYQVRVDQGLRPRVNRGDLVLAFTMPEEKGFLETIQQAPDSEEDTLEKPFASTIVTHLRSGGKAIFLPLQRDFVTKSRSMLNVQPADIRKANGGPAVKATLTGAVQETPIEEAIHASFPSIPMWVNAQGQEVVFGSRVGKGTALVFHDGIIGTNRFIDDAQNAQLLMDCVSTLAPRGTTIVFAEAAFGNVINKGFLEALGGWLDAAWQQFLLLAVVVIYTLGKRLGLPEQGKHRQRGSRELVDALATTMQRAHNQELAMQAALDRADQELRIVLKLPRETVRARRDELIPADLAKAIAVLEASILDDETPDWEAARRIKKLDEELDAFLGSKRLRRAVPAKIKP